MSKKKQGRKSGNRNNQWANANPDMAGMGAFNPGTAPAWNPEVALGAAGLDKGLLNSLQGLTGSRGTEQFILGALIGAAAMYVLGDEEMRSKIVKAGVKLYAGVAGGFEEIKEQMADIRAEVEAEQSAA